MSNFLLTPQERDRFVFWLDRQATSNEDIAAQLERIGGPPMLTMAMKNRHDAAAMRVVQRALESIEFQTIAPQEEGRAAHE